MNGLELLKSDHKRILFLIDEFERTLRNTGETDLETNRECVEMFGTLKSALTEHTIAEERTLFPELKRFIEIRILVDECCREDHRIGETLDKLQKVIEAEPRDRWDDLLFELDERIQSHVVREEDWLFPRAELLLDAAQREEMFFEIEQMRSSQSGTDSLFFQLTDLASVNQRDIHAGRV